MKLTLYTNTSDHKRVGKSLAKVWELDDVHLKEDTDILHPTFTFHKFKDGDQWLWKNFNYCMLHWHGLPDRYYNITTFKVCKGGIIEIKCDPDVRESWKDYIVTGRWLVSRQEHVRNPLMRDSRLKLPEVRQIDTDTIGTVGDGGDGSIILTVSG